MVLQVSGSVDAMRLTSTDVVVNEGGANRDFRVESDGNTHMLFVDASENKIGVGSSSLSDATIKLKAAGFEPGDVTYIVNTELLPNTVISQSEIPGSVHPRERKVIVNLVVTTEY